jgi:uncharacterized membrane protein (UPF0127 family)
MTIISIKINKIFKTPDAIEHGLMFNKKLPINTGALFCMPVYRNHKFWMKNTYVSLDVIFLDKQFKVVGFIENTTPLDLSLVSINKPSMYVIEINAGFAKQSNLKVGDYVKTIFIKKTRYAHTNYKNKNKNGNYNNGTKRRR